MNKNKVLGYGLTPHFLKQLEARDIPLILVELTILLGTKCKSDTYVNRFTYTLIQNHIDFDTLALPDTHKRLLKIYNKLTVVCTDYTLITCYIEQKQIKHILSKRNMTSELKNTILKSAYKMIKHIAGITKELADIEYLKCCRVLTDEGYKFKPSFKLIGDVIMEVGSITSKLTIDLKELVTRYKEITMTKNICPFLDPNFLIINHYIAL